MKKKITLTDGIIFMLIILYVYASLSKLVILTTFKDQLRQSPLIPPSAIDLVAYIIPLSELIIVGLFFIERSRMVALYASFFLMLIFTSYLVMLVSIDENLPCSCGGILGKMSYQTHIVFNVVVCIINLVAIMIDSRKLKMQTQA